MKSKIRDLWVLCIFVAASLAATGASWGHGMGATWGEEQAPQQEVQQQEDPVETLTAAPVEPLVTVDADGCHTLHIDATIEKKRDLAWLASKRCVHIDGDLSVQNADDIADLSALSGLRSVTGSVQISENKALERLELDELRRVGGRLQISDNPELVAVSLPRLVHLQDDLVLAGLGGLAELDLSRLASVFGNLIFERTNGFERLYLPSLLHVEGSLVVHFNAQLRELSAPQLEAVYGDVQVARNAMLETVDMPELAELDGDMHAVDNGWMPGCAVDRIIAGLSTFAGRATVRGNAPGCEDTSSGADRWARCNRCEDADS